MKSIRYYMTMATALIGLLLSSCSESFLDQPQDERTEIDSEDKVIDLLKSAYPSANYEWIAELSSDNLIDNWSPHYPTKPWDKQVLTHYNYSSYDRWDDQLFKFEPATMATYSDYDSPGSLWEGYYASIAQVNAALQAIEELQQKEGGLSKRLRAARAEALLLRAYDHFCLANMFCVAYKDDASNSKAIGIPYVTEMENVVQKHYDRGTLKETYDKIRADLEAGLADQNDEIFEKPKWHFNANAAHAFAARFYLYTRDYAKVIEHADAVLGTNNNTLLNMMMDYSVFTECSTGDDYSQAWQNPGQNNNLMLMSTGSLLQRRIFGYRYSCAGPTARNIFLIGTSHAFWSSYYVCPIALVSGMCFGNSSHDYGFINSKIFEQFEYSDKIARIGYPHIILRAFTSMELLLNRAEAKLLLGKTAEAAEDLCAYWNNSIDKFSEADYKAYFEGGYIKKITPEMIRNYYSNPPTGQEANSYPNWDFTQGISPDFVVSAEAVPYMNCINEFRRFETMAEGLRFFDLKRWGIEWSHEIGVYSEEIVMTQDDPNRAIEVPWEAISAGMASSRGVVAAGNTNELVLFDAEDFRIK